MKKLEIREIEHKGIKVTIKLDYVNRTLSLVECTNPNGKLVTNPKSWIFTDRKVGYVRTWKTIIEAMGEAIAVGYAELEVLEKDKIDAVLTILVQSGGGGSVDIPKGDADGGSSYHE